MGKYATSSSQAELRLDPAFYIVFLILACACGGYLGWTIYGDPIDESSFVFPDLIIDEARLESERQRARKGLDARTPEMDLLRTMVREVNVSEFRDGEPIEDKQTFSVKLRHITELVLAKSQYTGFVAVGEGHFAACLEGLEGLRTALSQGNLSYDQASSAPDGKAHAGYRKHCGNLLPKLIGWDLIDKQGRWTRGYSPQVTRILLRYRWAHMIEPRKPARYMLTPYEQEILLRWRIEDPRAFPVEKRRTFLKQAKRDLKSYDLELAEALLDAASSRWRDCRDHFEKLVQRDPGNPAFRKRLAYLDARWGEDKK